MADESKSVKVSFTLPKRLIAAAEAAGEPLGLDGGDYLKHFLLASYTQPDGVHLNLQPVTECADPAQGELFGPDAK